LATNWADVMKISDGFKDRSIVVKDLLRYLRYQNP